MVGLVICFEVNTMTKPKVISWDKLVKAAREDLQYTVLVKALQEEGQLKEGTSGICWFMEYLTVINGVVTFHGRSIVSVTLRG